jgi:hypothetical protein
MKTIKTCLKSGCEYVPVIHAVDGRFWQALRRPARSRGSGGVVHERSTERVIRVRMPNGPGHVSIKAQSVKSVHRREESDILTRSRQHQYLRH